jgi:hypothetical protein
MPCKRCAQRIAGCGSDYSLMPSSTTMRPFSAELRIAANIAKGRNGILRRPRCQSAITARIGAKGLSSRLSSRCDCLTLTGGCRSLLPPAHCHYRLQIARAAQTVARRGPLHGSLKGSAEPLVSGWRSQRRATPQALLLRFGFPRRPASCLHAVRPLALLGQR